MNILLSSLKRWRIFIKYYVDKKEKKKKCVKEKIKYTFDNFVKGKSNAIAYAICLDVVKKPLKYNHIYIYGGVGVGKTHLFKSVLNYYVEHYKNLKVLYITCKDFTDNYVESIIKHTENKIVDKYKNWTCF